MSRGSLSRSLIQMAGMVCWWLYLRRGLIANLFSVPAIEDPNTGIVLWESGAIIEYLIDQ